MNTKRQTIWLVAMLSLMVVLSAYYLFTQDLDNPDIAADTEATGQAGDGMIVSDITDQEGYTISDADQEMLAQLEAQGLVSSGMFAELLAEREASTREINDRVMAAIAETQSKPEEATAAAKELAQLEEKYEKIRDIEAGLMEQYEMALIDVDENNNGYKVIVTSESMEKKQAAAIIQTVMSTLNVEASQVSVQYVQ